MASATGDQEQEFLDDNAANLARLNQIITPLLPFTFISLYPVDFFLSHLIVPLRVLLMVRTGIVLFHAVLGGLAFTQWAKRHPNAFVMICFTISQFNILLLTVLTGGTESPYDEAMLACTFLQPTLLPWRTRYILPNAVLCAFMYPAMLAISGTLGDTGIWVSHMAVMFVGAGLASATTFFLERFRRAAFFSRKQLDKKSQDLESALDTIQEQQRNVNADLDQARDFQHKLLRPLPTDKNIDFAAHYSPADFLGGDFYEVATMGPGWYRIFMVDVTGHGTQAAMRTMILQQQLERSNCSCETPWALLATVNDAVIEAFGPMVVNYCALCIDFKKNEDGWMMTGTNAGMPEPMVAQQRAVTAVGENGTYQGILPELDYPRFERQMVAGDGIVLATDGVVDLLDDGSGSIWIPDQAHFSAALGQSAVVALDSVKSRIPPILSTNERSDDLTMLVVRIPQQA